MSLIEFRNVTKKYKETNALDNFSWSIEEGKIQALLGHNGAGKTTAFMIANGVIPFSSGDVFYKGRKLSSMKKTEKRKIGFLTEKLKLYEDLNVKDVLDFFSQIFNIENRKQKISELVDMFDMSEFLKKKIKKLSTGMYKKTLIAVTFLNDPDIVFLDEPFAGLDPVIVKEVSNILKNYRQDKGKTIIVSSHNLHEVEAVCEKVTIMKQGKKIESDNLSSLFSKYSLYKSFNVSYIIDGKTIEKNVENELFLTELLNNIKSEHSHSLSISENKITLEQIYNKIYQDEQDA